MDIILSLKFLLLFALFHFTYKYCFSSVDKDFPLIYRLIYMLILPFITSSMSLLVSENIFSLLVNLSLFLLLTIGSISDFKTQTISNNLILLFSSFILIINLCFHQNLFSLFVNAIIPFIFMYVIYIFSRNKLGGGDVKVFIPISMAIGFSQSFNALFLGSFLALIFLLIFKSKQLSNYNLPFIPFITMGVFLSYFIRLF